MCVVWCGTGLSDRFEDGMVVESTGPVTSCPLDPDGEGGEEESVLEEDMVCLCIGRC